MVNLVPFQCYVVRNLYQSDISYLTMLSLIGSEGFVADDYMYYVLDEEKGLEGLDKNML